MTKPNFPPLSAAKTTRQVTKHYTNLAMYEERSQVSFLTWLIYQSDSDNSVFIDKTVMLRYRYSVMAAMKEYKTPKRVDYEYKALINHLKALVSKGYLILSSKPKVYVINPMLVYTPIYITRSNYNLFQKRYQEVQTAGQMLELIEWYQVIINKKT